MLRNQFDKDHKVLWWKIMEIMKTDNSGLTHSSGAVVAEESIICAMLMGRIINCQNVFLRDRDENFTSLVDHTTAGVYLIVLPLDHLKPNDATPLWRGALRHLGRPRENSQQKQKRET